MNIYLFIVCFIAILCLISFSTPYSYLQQSTSTPQPISLSNLTQILAYSQYSGTWISNDAVDQFNYLTESQGQSYMVFLTNTSNLFLKNQSAIIKSMEMQLLNPKYPEEKEIFAFTDLSNYDSNQIQWEGESQMNYTGYYKFQKKTKSSCDINYLVSVTFSDPSNPTYQTCQIYVQIQAINKAECNIDYSVTYKLDKTNYQLEVILYCLFANIICACQFICVTKLCKDFMIDQQQDVQKISLITIAFVTIYDAFLCLQNLYFALSNYVNINTIQYYFIIPSFFYFLLSATCDMKLMWIVWRDREDANQLEEHNQRRTIILFFFCFYSALITYFILMYFLELDNVFLLLNSLFIVPQIIHNVVKGNNPKFITEYIFGILGSNVLYPLYFRGCPANFRGLKPSSYFCIVWISLFVLQIFLLYIQYKFGPRSFIPKCFLPKQYNYYQNFKIQADSMEIDECAICLGSLLMEPEQMEQNLDASLLTKKIMVTPCKHQFHVKCLKNWMDIKLNCPTCRKRLPAITE